ncbi:DNA mismatch repair endonuclease MutL [Aliikangiella coralliicola]|uniref:DNA mismatch repair protein MutL n=1 Tax=Aliikangiella coralliicola TaxID=2592383 RepID=A0A545UCM7_9GAMM|nr:DNA mismatch repair endonuclease MutL [Aliikangiella coralliicola]
MKRLDNRLANQIAAGEVVERPASVVKELMENSIDSDATRIEVDIERGGTRLIRVTDNGKGIDKDDLSLALTRHATSKIQSSDDLACIQSLGFRGEALASISAVSKLTLTSRTHDSELAWQAMAHGRDMSVEIQPAAASPGTRIEVADLFFNTPARQKFLRTEKTEFNHVEEVFKRHALANFSKAFVLKHNHKIVKRVPASGDSSQYLKRVATICGKPFADSCVEFNCQHELLQLFGWLGKPSFHRSESDIQYVFINGRPVKDKTLNHAIRQAYEGLLPPGRMAAYVIFLSMDPHQIDVNVHPTKHEVRFGQQRLVHDLLVKSVAEAIGECELVFNDDQSFNSRQSASANSEAENRDLFFTESTQKNGTGSHDAVSHDTASHGANPHEADLTVPVSNVKVVENRMRPVHHSVQNTQTSYDIGNFKANKYRNTRYSTSPSALSSEQGTDYAKRTEHSYVPTNRYSGDSGPKVGESFTQENAQSRNGLLPVGDNLWITCNQQQTIILHGQILLAEYIRALLNEKSSASSQPLLFPLKFSAEIALLEDYQTHLFLERLGFVFKPVQEQELDSANQNLTPGQTTSESETARSSELQINQVPMWLCWLDNSQIVALLSEWLSHFNPAKKIELFSAEVISNQFEPLSDEMVNFIYSQLSPAIPSSSYRRLNAENFSGLFK